jgi:hypothetical protein
VPSWPIPRQGDSEIAITVFKVLESRQKLAFQHRLAALGSPRPKHHFSGPPDSDSPPAVINRSDRRFYFWKQNVLRPDIGKAPAVIHNSVLSAYIARRMGGRTGSRNSEDRRALHVAV